MPQAHAVFLPHSPEGVQGLKLDDFFSITNNIQDTLLKIDDSLASRNDHSKATAQARHMHWMLNHCTVNNTLTHHIQVYHMSGLGQTIALTLTNIQASLDNINFILDHMLTGMNNTLSNLDATVANLSQTLVNNIDQQSAQHH